MMKQRKVLLCYNDNINEEYHKTIRFTLSMQKWKMMPTVKLLTHFIEKYNAICPNNTLDIRHVQFMKHECIPVSNTCEMMQYIPIRYHEPIAWNILATSSNHNSTNKEELQTVNSMMSSSTISNNNAYVSTIYDRHVKIINNPTTTSTTITTSINSSFPNMANYNKTVFSSRSSPSKKQYGNNNTMISMENFDTDKFRPTTTTSSTASDNGVIYQDTYPLQRSMGSSLSSLSLVRIPSNSSSITTNPAMMTTTNGWPSITTCCVITDANKSPKLSSLSSTLHVHNVNFPTSSSRTNVYSKEAEAAVTGLAVTKTTIFTTCCPENVEQDDRDDVENDEDMYTQSSFKILKAIEPNNSMKNYNEVDHKNDHNEAELHTSSLISPPSIANESSNCSGIKSTKKVEQDSELQQLRQTLLSLGVNSTIFDNTLLELKDTIMMKQQKQDHPIQSPSSKIMKSWKGVLKTCKNMWTCGTHNDTEVTLKYKHTKEHLSE